MANSMAVLSRRVYRSLLSNANTKATLLSKHYCTAGVSSSSTSSDSDNDPIPDSPPSESAQQPNTQRRIYDRPLEDGLDMGIYKAILIGQVGQAPVQKKLRSGMAVTMFSLGTGGVHNNRRPHPNEEPQEYANRCAIQWHRVSVYPETLGGLLMKHAVPGTTLYLEGNLETKIFTDPITGMVRKMREIAIRRNGRVVFLGNVDNPQKPIPLEKRDADAGFKEVNFY